MSTEKMKHRARINAKGLDTTGVTEDHARAMASALGGHHLFIVEGRATSVVTDEEGNQQVAIVLTQVEPVPAQQEETVREFMRALYRQRPDQIGQETLRGTADGPSVADAAGALSAHVERDSDGEATGIWDGNLDGPLEASGELTVEECGFPGCTLEDEHDGDHNVPEEEDEPEPEPESSGAPVVDFKAPRASRAKRG